MKTLVTGATGFIGRHLIDRLLREGHQVCALVRPETNAASLQAAGVEIARGDICDYAAVERATAGCRVVFHLAAKTEALELPKRAVERVNVEGTANVARAAAHNGIDRLVFASSVGVYGRMIRNLAIDEQTEMKPDSPYGESKVLSERIVLAHHRRDRLPVVLARLTTVLGPGARSWTGFFETVASGRFRLIGSGTNHHHLVDVADTVEALMLCATAGGVEGRTYVIAGNEPIQLREFACMIGDEFEIGLSPASLPAWPLHLYSLVNRLTHSWTGRRLPRADRIDFFLGDRIFDISRARRELGYRPKINMREAVNRMSEWFRAQGCLSASGPELKSLTQR